MVGLSTKIGGGPDKRAHVRADRVRRIYTKPGLRVEPANDDMRRLLKHPRAGGFRSEGSIEWPDDMFTRRRLRDGSVKLAEKSKPPGGSKTAD
jgi:hypothetical protein